jgi:hypothetical protein
MATDECDPRGAPPPRRAVDLIDAALRSSALAPPPAVGAVLVRM